MRKKVKQDEVSVSFHSLVKTSKEGAKEIVGRFKKSDIESLYNHLEEVSLLDLSAEDVSDKIRYRNLSPIVKLERVTKRLICGQYEASYWGHSYKNSDKGNIKADSINLRPFFFLIYLSASGRIYIGSQYLGNFGGYSAIKNTILSNFSNKGSIKSTSFNFASENFQHADPKEVIVSYFKKGEDITSKKKLGSKGVFSFKLQKDEVDLKKQVKDQLLLKSSPKEVRRSVANILSSAELIELDDSEIENCRVLATIQGGRPKTFYLIEGSNFATRFHVDVTYRPNGHPKYKKMKKEAIRVLKEIVLSRVEGE